MSSTNPYSNMNGYPNYGPYATGPNSHYYPGYSGSYYTTPNATPASPVSGTTPPGYSISNAGQSELPTPEGQLPLQQSYIENILRLNLGKIATIYMTFENNSQWNAKVFKGKLEAAGRDHIIISDVETGRRYLLLMVNLDYITFDEPLYYTYPYAIGNPPQNK